MLKSSLCLLTLTLASWAQSAPDKSPVLPVIEIRSASPQPQPPVGPSQQTIELQPIKGQGPGKLSGQGRLLWGNPYGPSPSPGQAGTGSPQLGAPGLLPSIP